MYLFSTGPYDLNIMMRAKAKGKGLTLSQYGLFNGDGSQLDHGETEEEIFALLDIPYLTPQQRENWRDHLIQQPKESAVQVKSSSGEGSYSVTIKEGKAVDCECQGFAYRSRCRHLEEAEAIYRQNSTR
jgi:DNA polymerase (family 10)